MNFKLIDLFAGIGGFSLAGHMTGWETLLFCENASYPKKILNKNFPGIPIHDDIKDLTKEIIEKESIKKYGYYDANELIFTGGVPCQPASQAGKRKGTKDDRWLWDPTLRIVREVKPAFAVFENVIGLLSLEDGRPFEGILATLENEGYQVESFIIPACGVGAWHRRDRIWIIAYNYSKQWGANKREPNARANRGNDIAGTCKDVSDTLHNGNRQSGQSDGQCKNESKSKEQEGGTQYTKQSNQLHKSGRSEIKDVSDTESAKCKQSSNTWTGGTRFTNSNWWDFEPELGRVAARIPDRVDRLKGLGNAIVPQVAFEIFKAIDKLNKDC